MGDEERLCTLWEVVSLEIYVKYPCPYPKGIPAGWETGEHAL